MSVPQRPASHVLEESSNRFFLNNLPANWIANKPQYDYGIDYVVDIFEGTNATNYQLLVQLKASRTSNNGDFEKCKLRVATYNHLRSQLHVAMVIKYVEEANEAYYILLVDVNEPSPKFDTFTINIPKNNRLSTINWDDIESYIREVVDCKLTAGDVIRERRKNR